MTETEKRPAFRSDHHLFFVVHLSGLLSLYLKSQLSASQNWRTVMICTCSKCRTSSHTNIVKVQNTCEFVLISSIMTPPFLLITTWWTSKKIVAFSFNTVWTFNLRHQFCLKTTINMVLSELEYRTARNFDNYP